MPIEPSKRDLAAVVLAGGAGLRVGGRDKGLMEQGGVTLVERVLARLAPQIGQVLISANRNQDRYARFGFPVVADLQAGFHGPLAGISAALAQSPARWLLTVPVDALEFPGDLAVRLHQRALELDAAVTVAHDGTRRQPLFALYRRELAEAARRSASEDAAVWRFQDSCGAQEVQFPDAVFGNLNELASSGG
jgi:molybdopterin-guanine dinucleotide biosynthesis protein A